MQCYIVKISKSNMKISQCKWAASSASWLFSQEGVEECTDSWAACLHESVTRKFSFLLSCMELLYCSSCLHLVSSLPFLVYGRWMLVQAICQPCQVADLAFSFCLQSGWEYFWMCQSHFHEFFSGCLPFSECFFWECFSQSVGESTYACALYWQVIGRRHDLMARAMC